MFICMWTCRKEIVGIALESELARFLVKSTCRVQKGPFFGLWKAVFTAVSDGGKSECAVEFTHLL